MNFVNDVINHIEELEAGMKLSSAGFVARVVATVKADPAVAGALAATAFVFGLLVSHL